MKHLIGRKALAGLLILLAALCLCAAASASGSGDCGNSATWALDDNGVLTISGTGAVSDYPRGSRDEGMTVVFFNKAPWGADIKKLVVEPGITSIGKDDFFKCGQLTSVSLPDTLTRIGYDAFEACTALKEFRIPAGVTRLEEGIFRDCTGLEKVILPSGITQIDGAVFYRCTALKGITIPEGVTRIGSSAFASSGLVNIRLPKSLTYIQQYAFYSCTHLKDVYYAGTVADRAGLQIDSYANSWILDAKWHYQDTVVNGLKYALDPAASTAAVTGPADRNLTDLRIPAKITAAGASYQVTEIAAEAFSNCRKLTKASIGKNVRTIGKNAFLSCGKLKTVSGGAGLVKIGDGAFLKCGALTAFTLGKNMARIGKNAFNACKKLKAITVKTAKLTAKSVGSGAFKGIYKKAVFTCPKKLVETYREIFLKKGAPKTAVFK